MLIICRSVPTQLDAVLTKSGAASHARVAATGNARSPGASTPYKRWSKCSMEKVRGGVFCSLFYEIKGEANIGLSLL